MRMIRYMKLEITPSWLAVNNQQLRIRLTVDDREVDYERELVDDDMTSRFDVIFDSAREALRRAILEAA